MKRRLALAVAAFAALGGPGGLEAQEAMGRRASLFDLGIYGGAAYTTDWFESRTVTSTRGVIAGDEEGDGEGHRIGFAPMFGAAATFYGLPWFGVRVHYGYMPSDLPEADGDTGAAEDDGGNYFVNNHFADLSLVFRLPGVPIVSSLVGNLYGFVGGGGLITNVAGEGEACVASLLSQGACLSFDPDKAAVGQGTVGIGGDIVSLTNRIGLFAELAAHIYDSPVHVGDAFVPRVTVRAGEPFQVADDKFATTGRLVAGLKFAFGAPAAPAPMPAPVQPAPPPAPAPPPPPPAPAMQPVTVCVVQGGALTQVQAQYNPATGDTMVMGQRFATAHPATAPNYAASESWFINNQSVTLNNREYVRFGVPRVIPSTQLSRGGEFQGVPLFTETGTTGQPQVVYVPLRPGCEFQPYQLREQIRVRGN